MIVPDLSASDLCHFLDALLVTSDEGMNGAWRRSDSIGEVCRHFGIQQFSAADTRTFQDLTAEGGAEIVEGVNLGAILEQEEEDVDEDESSTCSAIVPEEMNRYH